MAKNPYGGGPPLNVSAITHPGTLIGTAGHLHPGGLYDELDVIRAGGVTEWRRDPRTGAELGAPVPLERPLLRQARTDLVGHGDDRDRSRLAPARQRRRPAADQRHVRDQARLVVRVDGDHGRLGGLRRPVRYRPVHDRDRSDRARHPRPPRRERPSRRLRQHQSQSQEVPDLLHPQGDHRRLPLHPGRLHLDRQRSLHADDPRRDSR